MTATAKRREDRYMSALDLAQAFRMAVNTPNHFGYPQGNHAHPIPGSSLPQSGTPQQIIVPPVQRKFDTPPVSFAIPTTPVPPTLTPSASAVSGTGG